MRHIEYKDLPGLLNTLQKNFDDYTISRHKPKSDYNITCEKGMSIGNVYIYCFYDQDSITNKAKQYLVITDKEDFVINEEKVFLSSHKERIYTQIDYSKEDIKQIFSQIDKIYNKTVDCKRQARHDITLCFALPIFAYLGSLIIYPIITPEQEQDKKTAVKEYNDDKKPTNVFTSLKQALQTIGNPKNRTR